MERRWAVEMKKTALFSPPRGEHCIRTWRRMIGGQDRTRVPSPTCRSPLRAMTHSPCPSARNQLAAILADGPCALDVTEPVVAVDGPDVFVDVARRVQAAPAGQVVARRKLRPCLLRSHGKLVSPERPAESLYRL